MHLENSLTIAAPVHRVWDLTIDIERWSTLTPTILSVERLDDGELRVGSSARVAQPRMPVAVWTVTELEPLSRFVWEARILGSRFVGGHHLTSTPDGVRNALTLDVNGWTAGLLSLVAGSAMRQAIATENEGFRRVALSAERPGSEHSP
jgi:carbon monoxide dehydrogenase subunit G